MKEKIAMRIAWMLPPRILFWAVLRGFADATTGKYGNRIADEVTYKEVHDSLVEKYNLQS